MKFCKVLEMGNDINNKIVKFFGYLVFLKEKN